MKVAPWVKWYAGDFLHGVVELGPNEGWVYTIVLNLIYDRGGPIPDDMNRLARRCNMRPTSVEKALAILVEAGKLMRADGVLSNARADKEMKSRQEVGEKSTKAISSRWEKVRGKAKEINDAAVPTNYERNTEAIPTRSQKPDNTLVAPATSAPAAPDRFEEFWQIYPKRVGDNPKKPAREMFASKVKAGADPDRIIAAARNLRTRYPKPERHIPMAKTWLYQERFTDEEAGAAAASGEVSDDRWLKRLKHGREKRQWFESEWGPMPGAAGCRVPKHLLTLGDGAGWISEREAA